ncbi:glucose dehydrogenase [FAD, quinone]-like [Spodoptera litura]|uniref:Glucose dehydrogenase [FAD, quinone]-like n=1 Tax=Spodoptera litura TaxID=69820 RepID=A0A9J7EHD7_SPOLT|nr:glucose dehydrogenase [FAD, quinone]-like [Spodoptera litura]
MNTTAQLAQIANVQSAFSVLAMLNMYGYLYPEDAKVSDGDTYDYIVIGGGTAGCVVAARLAEANFKTLIIEAGPNPSIDNNLPGLVTYLINSHSTWNFTTLDDGFTEKCHQQAGVYDRGYVLGGSGAVDYMIYSRGNPRDYERFSIASNDPSWNWTNMQKYFKKSEKLYDTRVLKSRYGKYHGTEGNIGVTKENRSVCDEYLEAYKNAGEPVVLDGIGAGILGYSTALYHIAEGVRTETATGYLTPIKDNPNLHITRGSMATKIIFDDNKTAVGVEFVKNGQTITVKARKEVILTAGPFKSPQLLMLSGIGPKDDLEGMNIDVISNLPVGRNLQNSIGPMMCFKTNREANPEPFDAHQLVAPMIIGNTALNKSSHHPDYVTVNFIVDDYSYFLSFCAFTIGLENSVCDRIYSLADNKQMLLTVLLNVIPKSQGVVKLRSTDPFDQPQIFNGYYSNDEDLDAVVEYMKDYVRIEGFSKFQSMGLEFLKATDKCDQFEFGSTEYWRCYALCMVASTIFHCGTCPMGTVVDNQLNVIGVHRLRVVDASVIPNPVSGSIFAPLVAVAERASDLIIKSTH